MPKTPKQIVDSMISQDTFAVFLGIEILSIGLGTCKLQLTVKAEMLNGLNIAHGGISYSLADTALAFAASSHGNKCVSVETSIAHLQSVFEGDTLIASVTEESLNRRIGVYSIQIHNQENILVARFKGKVYRKDELW